MNWPNGHNGPALIQRRVPLSALRLLVDLARHNQQHVLIVYRQVLLQCFTALCTRLTVLNLYLDQFPVSKKRHGAGALNEVLPTLFVR